MKTICRVGYIVDGLVPTIKKCVSSYSISPLVFGWPGNSSIQSARLDPFLSRPDLLGLGLRYELYRPWRRYAALVFLKSMNEDSLSLARKYRRLNIPTVFDLNVDYLSPTDGIYYYQGMAPSLEQNQQALEMVRLCSAVIADSNWLGSVAQAHHPNTIWIPDCIEDSLLEEGSDWIYDTNKPLPVLWCGESVKLFDLLVIEDVLRKFNKRIHLRIITNNMNSLAKIYQPWRGRLKKLLSDVDVEIVSFQNIAKLIDCYDQGGVFISPRFLDNTYNLGHTEWKITLPMARGRVVLCSPQASYMDISRLSDNRGIRVCSGDEDWVHAFDSILSGRFDWEEEQQHACRVVKKHYSASVVASIHGTFMKKLLSFK